jgi:hypothetical protein
VAADLTHAEPEAAELPAPSAPRGRSPYRARFRIVYGLLAAAVIAGGAGIAIWAGRAINAPAAWSAWRPHGGGLGAAKEIADHIGGTYHLSTGPQLVDVIAKAPFVAAGTQQVPIHYLAMRGPKGATDAVVPVSSSDSLTYSLCGLGQSCAIATGKPSVARGLLVRREILELALYTFKYVGGINHVIAFMPPAIGNPPQYAIYLQKSDLAAQLKVPLARTLSLKVPSVSSISAGEQQTIDGILGPRTYKFSLAQGQQGDAILVLTPFAA